MFAKPEPAGLVIADISGYTGYLAGAELEHAQDVLADLMDTVVTSLRPLFRLAKLEGDAAFCYVVSEALDATQILDTIDGCYFAFRRRLRDIGNASACECNACILIPALDLKVVVHHGNIGRQRIAGSEELVGSEVILIHRLLKNTVEEDLGLTAYAVYTDAAIGAMGLQDPAATGLVRHHDSYDVIGEVGGWVRDLTAAWEMELAGTRFVIDGPDALLVVAADLPGPAEIVWEWVNSPIRRPRWQAGVIAIESDAEGGRYGIGAVNHCIHGEEAIVEEILDWRPFEYVSHRSTLPDEGAPPFFTTYAFLPTEDGTRVEFRVAAVSEETRPALEAIGPMLEHSVMTGMHALGPLIEADLAERAAREAGSSPEPEIPPSGGRHLSGSVDIALSRSSS